MKKLIGMIAIATVFSVVMMGCQPPAEGDTAPAPDASKTATDTKTPATTAGETK
jgi:hypothetical protein